MLIPIILSGGVGARLWPISRESHPKPFMKLPDGQSLLQKTFARASALEGVREVLTITNREHYFKSRDEYQLAKKTFPGVADTFLLEPFGRNTAAAIALGALKVAADSGDEAIMLVLPADHLIEDQGAFAVAVKQACDLAEQGKLVTFGIVPNAPETGFGYIEADGQTVKRFVEKPSYETAVEYVDSGRYLWNSGMFCFQAGAMLEQFKLHAPSIYEHALACWEATRSKTQGSTPMMEIDSDTFAAIPENSIDYAVMEKSEVVAVVPGNFGWSDIGSWLSFWEYLPKDESGNVVVGDVVLKDCVNSYVNVSTQKVALMGIKDSIVVEANGVVLVVAKEKCQDLKGFVV